MTHKYKLKTGLITCIATIIALTSSVFIELANANTIEKTITLIGKDGSKLQVAKLILTPQENKNHSFEIKWDESKFSNHFLSMRPFQCIDGPQTFCHLGYPYKTKNRISKTDLQDLEYALLFIHKNEKEYGINFWNGVYYRLKRESDGTITGSVWETDMNELASPPEKEFDRPIGGSDLVEGAEGKHRFPKIIIQ
ncbi:hypothetical protein NBRC116602_03110 [Hyphomicrobiales bacterium 4NK60-0047b]